MNSLIKGFEPGLFNQAMMEFGALQCVPRKPKCNICTLKGNCFLSKIIKLVYYQLIQKKKTKTRFFNFIVFHNSFKQVIIEKREPGYGKIYINFHC